VHGTTRDIKNATEGNLAKLGIGGRVIVHRAVLTDFQSVKQVLNDAEPGEIFNLAGLTSVGLSFEQPDEAFDSIVGGTLNILKAIRTDGQSVRFYNACSSECFGYTGETPATEETPFDPVSPYATAKAEAFQHVSDNRETHGLFACSGIMFNHESPLRPSRFVTRKIVQGAARIAASGHGELVLGNLDIERDWGWAPEYVEAMWAMLQQDEPDDYVVATGESHTLGELAAAAFAHFGLDGQNHVTSNPSLLRPADIVRSRGDATKAHDRLGWRAKYGMGDVVRMMAETEVALTKEAD
jgi:GDPmannose 4,6-dehydratase